MGPDWRASRHRDALGRPVRAGAWAEGAARRAIRDKPRSQVADGGRRAAIMAYFERTRQATVSEITVWPVAFTILPVTLPPTMKVGAIAVAPALMSAGRLS